MMLAKEIRNITLLPEISDALNHTVRRYTVPSCIRDRAQYVVLNSQGLYNCQIAEQLCCHENTVSKWVGRFRNKLTDLNELVLANRQSKDSQCYCSIEDVIGNILSDNPRSGHPEVFGLEVRFFIVWICCHDPKDYGFENNMWHLPQIHLAVNLSGIVDNISVGGIYSILMSNDLRPWKNKYYLHSKDKYEDNEIYNLKINNINLVYGIAQEQRKALEEEGKKSAVAFPLEPIEDKKLQDAEEADFVQSKKQPLVNNISDSADKDENNKILIDPTPLKKCAEKIRRICQSRSNTDFTNLNQAMLNEDENPQSNAPEEVKSETSEECNELCVVNDHAPESASRDLSDRQQKLVSGNSQDFSKTIEICEAEVSIPTDAGRQPESQHSLLPFAESLPICEGDNNIPAAEKTKSKPAESLLPFEEPVQICDGDNNVPAAQRTKSKPAESLLPFKHPVEVHDSEDFKKKLTPKQMQKKLRKMVRELKRNQRLYNRIQKLTKKLNLLDKSFCQCENKDEMVEAYYKKAVQLFKEVFPNADIEEIFSIYSFDEMTGVQALEDAFPKKNACPGKPGYKEYNYIRHGVMSLITFLDLISGKVRLPFINTTRTEIDIAEAFYYIIANDPGKVKYIFICDNLNVHKSEALVRMVAEFCGITDDLGVKDRKGILKNVETREQFLSDSSHRIFFIYTPLHCSWMNQVEIFFSIMTRQFIKKNSFDSLRNLKERVIKYINIYNTFFGHGFNWKYSKVPEPNKNTTLFYSKSA